MKFRLDVGEMTDEFFSETRLLGIMAPVKNYQFCWHLNHSLGYNFRLKTDVEIQLRKKNRTYFFSLYHHTEPNSFLTHYLYDNQRDGEYLIPEFKHMDYLWLMKGDTVDDGKCTVITASIKSIGGVQLVTELTNEKIKHKERMIF
ncbi:MAG TPA: IPExxxVDY family protein [Segetibacter sp.]|jgi:hypothetical protein